MKTSILTLLLMGLFSSTFGQQLSLSKLKDFEHQLDDVMEIIDTAKLKSKLDEVEKEYRENPNEINQIRLGIIYHETALNLSFFSETKFKGYAKKSYDTLTAMAESEKPQWNYYHLLNPTVPRLCLW